MVLDIKNGWFWPCGLQDRVKCDLFSSFKKKNILPAISSWTLFQFIFCLRNVEYLVLGSIVVRITLS